MTQEQLTAETIKQGEEISKLSTSFNDLKEHIEQDHRNMTDRWEDRFDRLEKRMDSQEAHHEEFLRISSNMERLQTDFVSMQKQFAENQKNLSDVQNSVVQVEKCLTEMMQDKKEAKKTFRNGLITAGISAAFGVAVTLITQFLT